MAVHGLAILLGRNETEISNRGKILAVSRLVYCLRNLGPTSLFTLLGTVLEIKSEEFILELLWWNAIKAVVCRL